VTAEDPNRAPTRRARRLAEWSEPGTRGSRGGRLSQLHPRRFFLETWRAIDREAALARGSQRFDPRPLIALTSGAVLLTLMEYFGSSHVWYRLLPTLDLPTTAVDAERLAADANGVQAALYSAFATFHHLSGYAWWSAWRVLGYFIAPALIVRLVFRGRVRDYGLETRDFRQHAWIYATLFTVVLVPVIGVSFLDEFADYYPFYKLATRSWFDLFAWELLYAAQFFSLEFFFRGFWLRSLRDTMGSHAIFAMVVPYCMIHFGKPWLEALGAIVAGVVLGTLAMKTRSIWSGFLIHVSVAISMDVAAILQTDRLPTRWWPGF
jgi:membrane protease YdiL (CAAX protease family)